MAVPECADMATVAMATELGHTSMYSRCCSSSKFLKDRGQRKSVKRKGSVQHLVQYSLFSHSSSLTHSDYHLWHIYISGCPLVAAYLCVSLCVSLSAYGHVVCAQVLDWIENHGEAFLSKHTGVGKSLHRARALQKRHEDFEEVAQVAWFFFLEHSHNYFKLSTVLIVICSCIKIASGVCIGSQKSMQDNCNCCVVNCHIMLKPSFILGKKRMEFFLSYRKGLNICLPKVAC